MAQRNQKIKQKRKYSSNNYSSQKKKLGTGNGTRYLHVADVRPLNFHNYGFGTTSEKGALTVPVVYACIRLIVDAVSRVPIKVYVKESGDTWQESSTHWLAVLLSAPNSYSTYTDLISFVVHNLLLHGNAYLLKPSRLIVDDDKKKPLIDGIDFRSKYVTSSLIPIDNDRMARVEMGAYGAMQYTYIDNAGVCKTVTNKDIWHIKQGICINQMLGFDALGGMQDTLNLIDRMKQESIELYQDLSKNRGFLMYENRLNDEVRESLRDSAFKNRNLMVLEKGFKFEPMPMNPLTQLLLEHSHYKASDIATFFGVPLELVGLVGGKGQGGDAMRATMVRFYELTIRPLLSRIQQSMERWILPREECGSVRIHFDTDCLLSEAERIEKYRAMYNMGALTPNEIRGKNYLTDVSGGDQCLVQSNMVGLSDVGCNSGS